MQTKLGFFARTNILGRFTTYEPSIFISQVVLKLIKDKGLKVGRGPGVRGFYKGNQSEFRLDFQIEQLQMVAVGGALIVVNLTSVLKILMRIYQAITLMMNQC